LTCFHTGFRSSELKSLKWSSVDLANRSITVQSCYSKNGEARTVPITNDIARVLEKMRTEREPVSTDPVFTHDGKAWHCWKEAFNGAVTRARLDNFRFQDLRHCYGSWLAMNNVPD
jgi:integrase